MKNKAIIVALSGVLFTAALVAAIFAAYPKAGAPPAPDTAMGGLDPHGEFGGVGPPAGGQSTQSNYDPTVLALLADALARRGSAINHTLVQAVRSSGDATTVEFEAITTALRNEHGHPSARTVHEEITDIARSLTIADGAEAYLAVLSGHIAGATDAHAIWLATRTDAFRNGLPKETVASTLEEILFAMAVESRGLLDEGVRQRVALSAGYWDFVAAVAVWTAFFAEESVAEFVFREGLAVRLARYIPDFIPAHISPELAGMMRKVYFVLAGLVPMVMDAGLQRDVIRARTAVRDALWANGYEPAALAEVLEWVRRGNVERPDSASRFHAYGQMVHNLILDSSLSANDGVSMAVSVARTLPEGDRGRVSSIALRVGSAVERVAQSSGGTERILAEINSLVDRYSGSSDPLEKLTIMAVLRVLVATTPPADGYDRIRAACFADVITGIMPDTQMEFAFASNFFKILWEIDAERGIVELTRAMRLRGSELQAVNYLGAVAVAAGRCADRLREGDALHGTPADLLREFVRVYATDLAQLVPPNEMATAIDAGARSEHAAIQCVVEPLELAAELGVSGIVELLEDYFDLDWSEGKAADLQRALARFDAQDDPGE